MASDVNICNMALLHLGAARIQSLTEASKEAGCCNTLYDSVRRTALRAHPWNFAVEQVELALTTKTSEEWSFVYSIPSDCLRIIRLVDFSSTKSIPMKRRGRYIYTDQEDAVLEYVKDVKDVNEFDDQFTTAFAYRLAADLAMPLTGKPGMQNSMMSFFFNEITQAKNTDAGENKTEDEATFLDARN